MSENLSMKNKPLTIKFKILIVNDAPLGKLHHPHD